MLQTTPLAAARIAARIALASAAVLALGGCHSLFAWHHPLSPAAVAVETRSEVYLAGQLVAGRAALAEGRFAEAITAFSRLRGDPGYDAEACNGLAVAWAGIGREDLAEAYFRRALALAPGEERYQRNFALLAARQEEARQEADGAARAALAAAAVPAAPVPARRDLNGAVRVVERPAGGLTRISPHEFALQTAPEPVRRQPGRSAIRMAALPRVVGTHGRTVALGAQAAPAGAYPVRIVFGRPLGAALR